MPTLLITGDDGAQRAVTLPQRTLRIGRSADNDVVLPDANKGVSRAHAELRWENGQYFLVDLQSQNGTWLDGARVEHARVSPNAEIAIGLYRLRLQAGAPTQVGDLPLYRPDVAVRAALSQPPSIETGKGLSKPAFGIAKPVLFGGGVALGMVVILLVRFLGFSPAQPSPAASAAAPGGPTAVASREVPPQSAPEPRRADAPGAPGGPSRADAPAPVDGPEPAPGSAAGANSDSPVADRPARSVIASPQRAAAKEAFDAGRKLDAADDWLGALRKFDEARAFDASYPGLDRVVKQVWDKLRMAGGDAFKRARQYDAIGDATDALKEYDKAVQWLPPGDPKREAARGRAEQLRSSAK